MCLAVPGRVSHWIDRTPYFAIARVAFGGVEREVNMQCVPEAVVGDYVLVHAGIAISRMDAVEAARLLDILDELTLLDEPPDGEPDQKEAR